MDYLSLVFFTLMVQAAVGLTLATGLARSNLLRTDPSGEHSNTLTNKGFTFALMLFVLAVIASLVPLNHQPLAFNPGRTSTILGWDMTIVLAFGVALLMLVLLPRMGRDHGELFNPIITLAIILGIVLVFAIANTLSTAPTANTWLTVLHFFRCTTTLGSTLSALLFFGHRGNLRLISKAAHDSTCALGLFSLGLMAIKVIAVSTYLQTLDISGVLRELVLYRLYLHSALTTVGLGLWLIPALRFRESTPLYFAALVFVTAGELLGQINFYEMGNM